jgi:chemotaxis protein MotB
MAEGHGGGGRERWLITYADMLTLLLAFFIIMYSISKADTQRFKKFQDGIQQAFHLTVLQGRNASSIQDGAGALVGLDSTTSIGPMPVPMTGNPQPVVTAAAKQVVATSLDAVVGTDEATPAVGPTATTSDLAVSLAAPTESPTASPIEAATVQKLRVSFADIVTPGARGDIEVNLRPEGIVISIYGVLLFDSGETTLRPDSQTLLRRVADTLRPLTYDIRVEGHTDSLQPQSGPYSSNWEISTARALAVTHFLIDAGSIDPHRLSAAGYAEFQPVATNDSRAGRLRNRRIDLVLLRPQSSAGASQ